MPFKAIDDAQFPDNNIMTFASHSPDMYQYAAATQGRRCQSVEVRTMQHRGMLERRHLPDSELSTVYTNALLSLNQSSGMALDGIAPSVYHQYPLGNTLYPSTRLELHNLDLSLSSLNTIHVRAHKSQIQYVK